MISEVYKAACAYMALTEIFDRGLPHTPSPIDKTEAFVRGDYRPISNQYARSMETYISLKYNIQWDEVKKEIRNHRTYTAQKWIDEYEWLKELIERSNKILILLEGKNEKI